MTEEVTYPRSFREQTAAVTVSGLQILNSSAVIKLGYCQERRDIETANHTLGV